MIPFYQKGVVGGLGEGTKARVSLQRSLHVVLVDMVVHPCCVDFVQLMVRSILATDYTQATLSTCHKRLGSDCSFGMCL